MLGNRRGGSPKRLGSFYIEISSYEKLDQYAHEARTSLNQVVRDIINNYIENKEKGENNG